MFKVNNKDTRRRSGIFIVNFEHIPHLVLVFLLLTLNMQLPAGKCVSKSGLLQILTSGKYIVPLKEWMAAHIL